MALERDFKKTFQNKLKRRKCTILQYKQDATTVQGFPDTIVLLPESLPVFIEFKKSKTAKFRPGQKEWIKNLNERGFFAFVVHPGNADEVMEEIVKLI